MSEQGLNSPRTVIAPGLAKKKFVWAWIIIVLCTVSFMSYSLGKNGTLIPGLPFLSLPGSYSHALGNATKVEVDNLFGSITVQVGNAQSGQVVAQTNATNPDLQLSEDNRGTLLVLLNNLEAGKGDLTVFVPSGVALDLRTTSGDINVDHYNGQLTARTESGSIILDNDTLKQSGLITTSGEITLEQGSMGDNSGLSTSYGAITLKQEALHGQFSAEGFGNSNIRFNGTLDPHGTYQFTTYKGNITVTVPPNTPMKVNISMKAPGASYSSDVPADSGVSPQATLDLTTNTGIIAVDQQNS